MSDSMEREKSERLTAREIEEEEMKRELTGIGIYEPGFTYKEMKRLLEFVNESQDTSNVTSNNKNTQQAIQHSDNECLSDVTSDINVQQEVTLKKCTEMPKPSYSYKLNHTSPTMHERRAVHYINSPEFSLFEVRSPIYHSDNDEQFEKQYDNSNSHTTNQYFSLRLENISRGCQNVTEKRLAQDTQSEIVQKLERWRLNPLDVCINENDVPLRQPNRSLARERMPFEHCKEAHMSDQCDRVIRSVNQHLKEMANLWYSWRPIISPIFQWGSPIQVSTANSSSDKKPLTNPKTEQIQAECTHRDGYERASKRKANTLIATLNRDSSSENEDDNQYDFTRNKKKRIQLNDKSNNVEYVDNQHAHASYKKENVIAGNSFSDDNSNTNIDNETNIKHSRSPELTAYPRRIRPPNPQTRLSLVRKRKENATSKLFPKTRCESENVEQEIKRNQKKDNTMTEEEIRCQLEEDWSNDEKKVCVGEKDAKFRPILKEVRLRDKRLSLNKKAKEARAAVKEEKSDEEQNNIKRVKLCERRKVEELCRIDNRNGSWEHELLSDEDKSSEMNQQFDFQNGNRSDNVPTNNVNCPICNKCFPHNEIENHAADCEQFEINNEEDDNDRFQFKCNICSNYKTNNGKEYEEHVYQCINIKNNQRHSHGF
ncbi:PREDICTED: uncharacterized protein LOC108690313 isoform X4 [Atta colombica]|uniref:uncharacterized protein LOC108690313 isoform X4 n=1 Tax=Atta colombica TaxID=520822 RepID=UPI00084BF2D9|nr:PREDICTED: uncharacterized protein LOC108690313 isoform X4 [Atta colombica]